MQFQRISKPRQIWHIKPPASQSFYPNNSIPCDSNLPFRSSLDSLCQSCLFHSGLKVQLATEFHRPKRVRNISVSMPSIKSKGQAEPTPFEHVSWLAYPVNFGWNEKREEREKEEGCFGKRPRRTFQSVCSPRSVRVSSSFDPLALSLSPLSTPLSRPLCSRNNHTVGRVHTIAPRSWHEHRVRGRSCASTPSFAPETVYNPLPSLQATVLPPHCEHSLSLDRAIPHCPHSMDNYTPLSVKMAL